MPKALLIAAALLFLLMPGCGRRDPAATNRPASFSVDRGQNPNQMIRDAVQSRTALSSLAGKGVMRIVDQPSKFGLTVNANIVADEQDRLRIRADKLAGAIQAFDVVMLGDDIGFYIPTQKTLYQGKVKDLKGFSFSFAPDEVLQEMLRQETMLLSKKWRIAEGGSKGSIILEEDGAPNRPRLQVALDQRNGTISSVTYLDARGQPTMVKRYGDYRSLARGRGNSRVTDDGTVFPYLISFSWPRDKRSMEMQFKQVQGNAPVSDEDFDLATSSDTRNRPLREARVDSDGDVSMATNRAREPSR